MFAVPEETSVNVQERSIEPYTLSFAPELATFIKSGQLTTAYRFGKKYDYLNEGDAITILDAESRESVGRAKIIRKSEVLFGDLPIEAPGQESYHSKDHQREVISGYYAFLGRPIHDDDPFLVFELELVR